MLVHVKKKAQITIPSKIRESIGITEVDVLDVTVRKDEIVLKPVARKKIKVKYLDASILKKIKGIISVGGDALKDSESIYD